MEIHVFRSGLVVEQIPLTAGAFAKSLMAEHELVFSLKTNKALNLQIGDYVTYKGEIMTINKEPEMKRDHLLEYSITFQGQRHTLSRFLLKDEGALTFDYSDSLENYLFMFLESINSVDSGWTVGELDEVEPFTLTFEKVDHLTALNMIAEACKCEWQLKNKAIYIKKSVGQFRDYPLSYGKDNGLYSIKRVMLENSKIVTRAYAVGGTNNLPAGYSFKQLTLSGFIEDDTAIDLFGLREGVIEDLEIYPRLKNATVKSVEKVNDNSYVIGTDLDFDLNQSMIDGQEAKIVFNSGMLNGQEFKILSYTHSTKKLRYEATKTANGDLVPSGAIIADIGDKYVLIGIRMPQSYVDAALLELTSKRLEYLNSNKVPRVVYEAPLDPLDLKRNNVVINEGDILPFKDTKIGLDDNMRITKVSYPACFPEELLQGMVFTAEIGKEVTYTRAQKVEKDIKETKEVITQYSKQSWENDRRNVLAMNEFKNKVFDPDGNLQDPLIQAIVALIGTDSMYYDLEGLIMSENAGNDPNAFALSACKLIHRVYKIEGLGYIWDMPSFSVLNLDPTKPYYLAAKCSKTTLSGEWVLTTDQKSVDDEIDYWFFNFGILSSVLEGKRSFQSTKLFTLISGGNVTTDTITAYLINVKKLFAQVITVGSEGYDNAGISGLADGKSKDSEGNIVDDPSKSVRFWAGANEQSKDVAPYQVLNDGSMKAIKGEIGSFNITENALKVGTNPEGSSWDINSQTVYMTKDYFLMRDNGDVAGERREFSWNLYKDNMGQPRAAAATVYNTINTALSGGIGQYFNVGLEIEADGGNENVALHIRKGDIYVGNKKGFTGKITLANTASTTVYYHFNYINGLVVDFVQNTSSANPF